MMKELGEQIALLKLLAETQQYGAPIELSIGWTDEKGIIRQGIVLKEAPPAVIDVLVEKDYLLSVTKHGVMVDRLPDE